MRKSHAAVALALLAVAGIAQAAADPQLGRWTIDRARSRYVSAALPRSSIATLVPYGGEGKGISLSVDAVTATGEKVHIEYKAKYDGKPYPRSERGFGAIPRQVVTLKQVAPRTVERNVYLDGRSGGTERWTISADGKTRTVVQSGIDLHGKPINNLQVYVKP